MRKWKNIIRSRTLIRPTNHRTMGAFFVYILKTVCCLAVFYLFYRLLLSRETFHRFNRFALLGILLLSVLLPLTQVRVEEPSEVQQTLFSLEQLLLLAEMQPTTIDTAVAESTQYPSWPALLLCLYLAGTIVFLIRYLFSLYRMLTLLRSGKQTPLPENIHTDIRATLLVHDKETAPFSWMHYIVINPKDLEENGREILTHELAHIANRHSWDLLIADLCILLQWFNPAAWLLKQELQNIHEYEADETVIQQGIDAKQYQLLIIRKAVGTRLYSMANSFNHSKLKKRITMMWKEKSNPWARLKYLYVLPAAAATAMAFASPEVSHVTEELSAAKVNEIPAIIETNVQKIAEKTPQAPAIRQTAQPIKINGTVLDAQSGDPLTGCIVVIKNNTRGVVTDKEGHFELEIPDGEAVLVFSLIGYQTIELKGSDLQSATTIKMEKSAQELDEVCVVGYERQTQADEIKKIMEDNEAFIPVEEAPEFPGGTKALMQFLARNIKYPADAEKNKTEGRVIVQFIVEKDGKISEETVVRSVSPSLDAEALRIIRLMPAWTPGKQRGKAVDIKFTLPITFRLEQQDGLEKDDILFLVNGEEVSLDIIKALDPQKIASIDIVKDPKVLEAYSVKGKKSIMKVTLKEADSQPEGTIQIRGEKKE